MLEFKNVTIKYNSSLVTRDYVKKQNKMAIICSFIAILCMVEIIVVATIIKSFWCIPVALITVAVTIILGVYSATYTIYSDSDNVSLYNHICNLRSLNDIYAGIYDDRILLRIIDDGTKYCSLKYLTEVNGITEEIIDNSNGSKDIQLFVEYSKDKVCIIIKED